MISVFGSYVGEAEIENVVNCMKSQWLGFGKYVKMFEEKYIAKFGIKNFTMVDSCSNGLFMAVKLLDLPPQSEIILPSFTWIACANSIVMAGHRPIFADVDVDTMNIRRKDIENKLSNKTAAIMVVHYAGLSVDLDPILDLGYPVIEDAAHAVCSTYKGKPCGSVGDIGVYSFDAVKNLTTGEGGGITARDNDVAERAKLLRYCGIGKSGFSASYETDRWWEYNIQEPFIKMLPTDMAGAIGVAQLDKIDTLQMRRKDIWEQYTEAFSKNKSIKLPKTNKDKHSYFTYCVRVYSRNKLARYLLDRGIYTTLRYQPLHFYSLYKNNTRLINTEMLSQDALNLPIHPRLTNSEVNKVIDTVKAFYD